MTSISKSDSAEKLAVLQGGGLVFLLGDEPFSAELLTKLEQANYHVQHFTRLSDIEAACENKTPAAVIIDIVLSGSNDLATKAISRLKEKIEDCPPVIVVSELDAIEVRLAVVRAGAQHYFCKPLDANKFIQTLDELTKQSPIKPYRVLLVDDDEIAMALHATMLRDAGMEVETLSDPLSCLRALAKCSPDVLITDIYMDKCSGTELVQVIRQDNTFARMPIIFLSSEQDHELQLAAMRIGADDFLVKPVSAVHMVSIVVARAQRARLINRLNKDLENVLIENELELITMDKHDIVSIADVDGRIISVNDRFCEISGYDRTELLGQNHRLIKSGRHPQSFYEDMWNTITQGRVWRGTICNRRKDGSEYWVESTIVPFLDNKGKPYKYVSACTDITELTQNEERLHRSQSFANIGTWDWNIRTGELYWSDRIASLFGYEKGVLETSYENFIEAVHPEDRQNVIEAVNNCVEHGAKYNIEHRIVWPDGEVRWMLERGDVVRSDKGEVLHMLGVVKDITKRKHVELALVDSERQLREAQALAKIGHWQADIASGDLTWSDEIYRIFGYQPGDFKPSIEAFNKAVHPDDLELVRKSEEQSGFTGVHDVVHRIVRPDGTIRHVQELGQAETDEAGNLRRLTGTVQDITEHVEFESRLRESDERFIFAVEGAGDGVWDWDMHTNAMQFSSLYMEMLGYAENELPHHADTWVNSVHPDDSSYVQQNLKDYLEGRKSVYTVELRLRCKDGSYKWILCRGTVAKRDKEGNALRMIGIHTDINARKSAESALQESQSKLKGLFELSPLGIALTDMNGRYLEFNKAFESITGYTADELSDLDYWKLTPQEYEKQEAMQLESLNTKGCYGPYEKVYRQKNGNLIPIRLNGMLVKTQTGEPQIWSIVEDITRSKRDEVRQQGNNHILKLIAEGCALTEVLEAITLHAETMLRDGMCSILFLDNSGKRLVDGVGPNLPDFYNEAINGIEIGMGVGSCGEAAFSGKRVIASDVMKHPNWKAFRELMQKAGLRACWSEPVFSSSGGVIATLAIYYDSVREPDDEDLEITSELAQFVAIVMEHSQAQQALVIAKEEAENANLAKSQFLSSMSHELRTPMNAIMGFGQLLKMETDPALTESQQENADEIIKASKHLLEIINEVLDLAKIEAGRMDLSIETVVLDEVIVESIQLITPLAQNRGIEISLTQDGAGVSLEQLLLQGNLVRADRIRLKQVLLNLLSNAVKYNNENGKIIIACNHSSDNQIRVSVTDTGAGLSQEQQSQLFKAFNRLVPEQSEIEGTGIGLVLARNIVEHMEGRIGVDSRLEEGSTFWIELPGDSLSVTHKNLSDKRRMDQPPVSANLVHKYTVLYIEDNPANLRLITQLFSGRSNIHIWSAHTPLLGLELAAEYKPDLILLDINLPGIDGFEVLKLLRQNETCCDTPVIAISANAMPRNIEKALAAGFDDYITKPIDVSSLLQIVEVALMEGNNET